MKENTELKKEMKKVRVEKYFVGRYINKKKKKKERNRKKCKTIFF